MTKVDNGNQGIIEMEFPIMDDNNMFDSGTPDGDKPADVKVEDIDKPTEPVIEEKDKPEEKVDTPPTTQTEPVTEPKADERQDVVSVDYKDVVSGIFGDIGNIDVGDGKVIPFTELDLSNKDDAISLIKNIIETRESELQKGKVDSNTLSPFAKQLIDVETAGGDSREYVAAYNKMQAPIKDLDPKNEKDGDLIMYHYYTLKFGDKAQEMNDEIINLIESDKRSDAYQEKVEKAKGAIDKAFDERIEKIKVENKEREEKNKQFLKEHSSKIKDALSKGFELNDATRNKVAEFAVKKEKDPETQRENLVVYNEFRKNLNDPELAAEMCLFLMDKEEYKKQIGNKTKTDTLKATYKLAQLSDKNRTGGGAGSDDDNNKDEGVKIDDL